MVIRLADGRETTIDYREMAPAPRDRDMFLDAAGRAGRRAQPRSARWRRGVPGSVAGLALAQRSYGRLPLAEVIAPAIALARDGFDVSWALADSLQYARSACWRSSRPRPAPSGAPTARCQAPAIVWCSPTSPRTLTLIARERTRRVLQGRRSRT